MGHDNVRNVIVHRITELIGDCILLRGQQVVAASHKAQQLAVGLAFDEESAHGGGQVSAAVQSNDPVIGRFSGGEEERFELPRLHFLGDVVGDHFEVGLLFVLFVHLLHQLLSRLHTNHNVSILRSQILYGEMYMGRLRRKCIPVPHQCPQSCESRSPSKRR